MDAINRLVRAIGTRPVLDAATGSFLVAPRHDVRFDGQ